LLPGYEVIAKLGSGGMGVVYKAWDKVLKRLVALKVLPADAAAPVDAGEYLRAEAEAAARLQHPHIVIVLFGGELEGVPFFVQEYVHGGSLAARIQNCPQPPHDAARLVQLLAGAIHHAHERGVVHLDLKPGNVLLAPTSEQAGLNTAYGVPK